MMFIVKLLVLLMDAIVVYVIVEDYIRGRKPSLPAATWVLAYLIILNMLFIIGGMF